MKSYCTQNNGDCATCSLVSYGKDCRNKPVVKLKKEGMYFDPMDMAEAKTVLETREDMAEFVRTAIKHEIENRKRNNPQAT
jgi:(2Fe-2S) ferredoxin